MARRSSIEVVRSDQPKDRTESHCAPRREPFRVKPHDFGFIPSLDLDKSLQLAGLVESLEVVKKLDS
jgi:hypothetical protein